MYKNKKEEDGIYDNFDNNVNEYYNEIISEDDSIDDCDDNSDEEYYNYTINIIKNELIEYIKDKSLPFCEFLTFSKLDNFISNYV